MLSIQSTDVAVRYATVCITYCQQFLSFFNWFAFDNSTRQLDSGLKQVRKLASNSAPAELFLKASKNQLLKSCFKRAQLLRKSTRILCPRILCQRVQDQNPKKQTTENRSRASQSRTSRLRKNRKTQVHPSNARVRQAATSHLSRFVPIFLSPKNGLTDLK